MNKNEICNMVISCAQGLLDGKEIQFRSIMHDTWHLAEDHNLLQIITGITNGIKYRVKPVPKTVRARMYWVKDSDKPKLAVDVNFDIIQSLSSFHGWAGNEQIFTVPEV